jgi:alanine racemase
LALRGSGVTAPIYVLAGHYRGAEEAVVSHGLTPVVGQWDDLVRLAHYAERAQCVLGIHLELDTGMARLGFADTALPQIAQKLAQLPALRVEGLMTHLSHADDLEAPSTPAQIDRLDSAYARAQKYLPAVSLRHVLNSGGLVCAPARDWDMVRCGLAMYGVQPVAARALGPLRPALRWTTQPVAFRTLQPGDAVSYGSHWRAQRTSIIATLPVGYADGYPRAMAGKAQVLIGGVRVPVVGTICMDLCMVDVTDVAQVTCDSEVVLLGSQGQHTLGAETLGLWANTIAYEILARIGPRVPRIYIQDEPC